MISTRIRVAAIAAGVAGMVALSAGAATAASAGTGVRAGHAGPATTYRTLRIGPFADEATCDAQSTEFNDPPDIIDAPCYQDYWIDANGDVVLMWFYTEYYSID